MMEGVIFDIKRFALHDGPGIRTTLFLKGCPLRCAWCHNPEGRAYALEKVEERTGPLAIGRPISVHEAMRELERDTNFYDESGGGITFSGGEPLAQHQFLVDLLGRCGELDIHRAVDTCGHAPREVLLNVAKQTDLFLYDLKSADDATHA
jgi:pyruvate formate lyase activating enzyme